MLFPWPVSLSLVSFASHILSEEQANRGLARAYSISSNSKSLTFFLSSVLFRLLPPPLPPCHCCCSWCHSLFDSVLSFSRSAFAATAAAAGATAAFAASLPPVSPAGLCYQQRRRWWGDFLPPSAFRLAPSKERYSYSTAIYFTMPLFFFPSLSFFLSPASSIAFVLAIFISSQTAPSPPSSLFSHVVFSLDLASVPS